MLGYRLYSQIITLSSRKSCLHPAPLQDAGGTLRLVGILSYSLAELDSIILFLKINDPIFLLHPTSYDKIYRPGGMAEWLKAHVLKTCVGKLTVGSNPSPSAVWGGSLTIDWGGARVVEWDRLLSGCRALKLDRGFESLPPRSNKKART